MVVFTARTNHEKKELKMVGKNRVYLTTEKWQVICHLAIGQNFWIPKVRELAFLPNRKNVESPCEPFHSLQYVQLIACFM